MCLKTMEPRVKMCMCACELKNMWIVSNPTRCFLGMNKEETISVILNRDMASIAYFKYWKTLYMVFVLCAQYISVCDWSNIDLTCRMTQRETYFHRILRLGFLTRLLFLCIGCVWMRKKKKIKQRMRERNKSIRSSTPVLWLFFWGRMGLLVIDERVTACHEVLLYSDIHVETSPFC